VRVLLVALISRTLASLAEWIPLLEEYRLDFCFERFAIFDRHPSPSLRFGRARFRKWWLVRVRVKARFVEIGVTSNRVARKRGNLGKRGIASVVATTTDAVG
jgi:hypothetical protein